MPPTPVKVLAISAGAASSQMIGWYCGDNVNELERNTKHAESKTRKEKQKNKKKTESQSQHGNGGQRQTRTRV
jgi:hypothetical protein